MKIFLQYRKIVSALKSLINMEKIYNFGTIIAMEKLCNDEKVGLAWNNSMKTDKFHIHRKLP